MPLDEETITHLRRLKDEIEEILSDVSGIIPEDFRMTCVLRYCGPNPDIQNMVWTDDVHEDVMLALEEEQRKAGNA